MDRSITRRRALVIAATAAALAGVAAPARASHYRGGDFSATVDADGVARVTARTRWRKGEAPFPFAGVDPSRFGVSHFLCPDGVTTVDLTPPTGLRVRSAADGATLHEWPWGSFDLEGTTVGIDTSAPSYDERIQVLVIPLGTVGAPGQVNTPIGLPHGAYDIVWNDWSRIRGIQNLDPVDACGGGSSGYGFRVRVVHDGRPGSGPQIQSTFISVVPRGFLYSQNLNVTDPDGDALAYALAPLSPYLPDFGPAAPVPGLTLDGTGQVRIPAADTAGLLENSFGEPGGDYLLKVVVSDARGFLSERDGLLDAVTTENRPPVLDPIGGFTVRAGESLSFAARATDPDAGQTVTLTASGLPAGASFSAVTGNPATGSFTWTPSVAQIGAHGVNVEATDSGTAALAYQDRITVSEHVIVTVLDPDPDGDGVPDPRDSCPGTAPGAVVDATGCSIDDLCPCAATRAGAPWRNHGAYVSCVTRAVQRFAAEGLVGPEERGEIVARAGRSSCGK